MAGGRPPIFETAEQFEAAVDAYFAECEASEKAPMIHGLCRAIGMTRETLLRYGEKEEFSDAVKRTRERLAQAWEARLYLPQCTGAIFWLKNNAGWRDVQEREVRHSFDPADVTDAELADIARAGSTNAARPASGKNKPH